MSTLFVMYDLETGRFVGSSHAGKFLDGIAEVHLTTGRVQVLDAEGRDLLADPKSVGSGPGAGRAAADIAAAFGVGTTPAADEPAKGLKEWDREPRR